MLTSEMYREKPRMVRRGYSLAMVRAIVMNPTIQCHRDQRSRAGTFVVTVPV
jgi:hypothetical protein